MNHNNEQEMELEALKEIYHNEIKVISRSTPISFSIKVSPLSTIEVFSRSYEGEKSDGDSEGSDPDDDGDDDSASGGSDCDHYEMAPQGFGVELLITLPLKYPDEKPLIEIQSSHNLDEELLLELSTKLSQMTGELLGTVMIFPLLCHTFEWLVTMSDREAEELELERDQKRQEAQAGETKRFDGTPVTEQSFLIWKTKFEAELLKAELEQLKLQTEQSGGTRRLTGKQMFETDKDLAESDLNFVEDLDQNQLEALLENIDDLELEDSEFNEGEDFDIEDENSEDGPGEYEEESD